MALILHLGICMTHSCYSHLNFCLLIDKYIYLFIIDIYNGYLIQYIRLLCFFIYALPSSPSFQSHLPLPHQTQIPPFIFYLLFPSGHLRFSDLCHKCVPKFDFLFLPNTSPYLPLTSLTASMILSIPFYFSCHIFAFNYLFAGFCWSRCPRQCGESIQHLFR